MIVAICDPDLVGKELEQDNLQLKVNEQFYKGEAYEEEKAIQILKDCQSEDACFNFVGAHAVDIGKKAGIINENCTLNINGIPHALALL